MVNWDKIFDTYLHDFDANYKPNFDPDVHPDSESLLTLILKLILAHIFTTNLDDYTYLLVDGVASVVLETDSSICFHKIDLFSKLNRNYGDRKQFCIKEFYS
jgi:hypothetical protein